jgi:hypothetical protein
MTSPVNEKQSAWAQRVAASREFLGQLGAMAGQIGTAMFAALGRAMEELRTPPFMGNPAVPSEAKDRAASQPAGSFEVGGSVASKPDALKALREKFGESEVAELGTKHMSEDVISLIKEGKLDEALAAAKELMEEKGAEESPAAAAPEASPQPASQPEATEESPPSSEPAIAISV